MKNLFLLMFRLQKTEISKYYTSVQQHKTDSNLMPGRSTESAAATLTSTFWNFCIFHSPLHHPPPESLYLQSDRYINSSSTSQAEKLFPFSVTPENS